MKSLFSSMAKTPDARARGERINSRVASSDTAYLQEINSLNKKIGRLLLDKKQLQLEIASLKSQVAENNEVHTNEVAQAGVGMKNCSEDGKLINSSSSLNSKEVEKISTNSLDLHGKDDTNTKGVYQRH